MYIYIATHGLFCLWQGPCMSSETGIQIQIPLDTAVAMLRTYSAHSLVLVPLELSLADVEFGTAGIGFTSHRVS